MFCPTDLPVAKYKAQQLQENLSNFFGDKAMEDYIVVVRAGYNVAHEEDDEGNVGKLRPDLQKEPCVQVTIHRKSDNMHGEEYWRPDFADKCRVKSSELDKAANRFVKAFDNMAAQQATKQ